MEMILFINEVRLDVPICPQIIEAAKKAILMGSLKIGEPFPSVRELSEHLKISPTTVHKAVQALTRAGYLIQHRGLGMETTVPDDDRMEELKPRFIELATAAWSLHVKIDRMVAALTVEAESVFAAKAREPVRTFRKPM